MSLNNGKEQGNQGKNYPYQLRTLQLLATIAGGVNPIGGLATEVTELAILTMVQKEGWVLIPGNSIDVSYFAGIAARNPSGNDNIDTILYKTGVNVVVTQVFTYDINDHVTNITAS